MNKSFAIGFGIVAFIIIVIVVYLFIKYVK